MIRADDTLTKMMWNIGEALIHDDRGDLGYTTYKGRTSHFYNGRRSPDHVSPLHHWQVGTLLCLMSQILSVSNVAAEAKAAVADIDLELDFQDTE